ncbi:MAG: hypothetical protein Q7T00_00610 [Rugosibacter sp.]|nr:hypothetical protein [Rugosibacter sp.]
MNEDAMTDHNKNLIHSRAAELLVPIGQISKSMAWHTTFREANAALVLATLERLFSAAA